MPTSFLGVLLSLATGCAVALYYTLNKKVATAGNPLQIIFWIFAAHLPPLLAWALYAQPLTVSWGYLLPGLGVLGLTVAGNLFSIRALSLSPFSLMLPVMCLSPVFTSLIGIPLLHEWPSGSQWIGIFLSVFGVLWLYAPVERAWDIFSFWPGFFRERGAPFMALSALSWSLSSPMDKLAMRHADPAFHALFVFTGLVIFLFFWLTLRGLWVSSPIAPKYRGTLFLTGAAGAAADMLQLLSLQHMGAGPFEAIKRVTSQVLALLIAYFLFKDRLTRPQLIGIGLICLGVPMIVL